MWFAVARWKEHFEALELLLDGLIHLDLSQLDVRLSYWQQAGMDSHACKRESYHYFHPIWCTDLLLEA